MVTRYRTPVRGAEQSPLELTGRLLRAANVTRTSSEEGSPLLPSFPFLPFASKHSFCAGRHCVVRYMESISPQAQDIYLSMQIEKAWRLERCPQGIPAPRATRLALVRSSRHHQQVSILPRTTGSHAINESSPSYPAPRPLEPRRRAAREGDMRRKRRTKREVFQKAI